MESLVGKTIGGYEINTEIGRGGMAIVYKAYHRSLDRYVALKVLPPQFAFDEDFVHRFQHEARASAKLKHANIVTVHDVGEQNGMYYIVMEFVNGVSLAELIQKQGAFAPARAAHIIAQVASALDYAHALGFVHRDVKSSNVVIGANDHATLTDFGIVKAAEGTRVTKTGTIIGTPEYMSPEQIRGQGVDARIDIYALGIVCYEMLTGRVPFQGETVRVLHAHVYEAPPPMRSINPRVPMAFESIVAVALAKDAAQRYAHAGDFARALSQPPTVTVVPPPPPEAPPTRLVSLPQARMSTHSTVPIIAGVVGGIVLLVVIAAMVFASSKPVTFTEPTVASAVTIVNADPYELAKRVPIPDGQAINVSLNTSKTGEIVDLFVEMANDSPAEISAFVAPFCDTSVFVGSTRIDASGLARPVWIHANRRVQVNGKFCVRIQSTPGTNTSIGQNARSQYLIRIVSR